MLLTLLGLGITTVISVVGVVTTKEAGTRLKAILVLLTLGGFGLATWAAKDANEDTERAKAQAKDDHEKLSTANQQLEDLRSVLSLVKATVGDLAILHELSGSTRYHVTIATDTSREGLAKPLKNLQDNFGGPNSKLISIREPKTGSKNYELVFGQGLDMAAAEIFQRLATSHHLPPPGQIAYIFPEPAPPAAGTPATETPAAPK